MSAFVVETELLDFLLTFVTTNQKTRTYGIHGGSAHGRVRDWFEVIDPLTGERWVDRIGQILHNENVRSVNHRYAHNPEMISARDCYRYKEHRAALVLTGTPLIVQVLKSAECLAYQSCERNDWEKSDARQILDNIRDAAIASLPGYDAAKWGAPDAPANKILSLSALAAGRANTEGLR